MAADPYQIIDPFHRALHAKLSQDLANRVAGLANGSVPNYEEYKAQVGYIAALNVVLDLCEELERDQYVARPGADRQTE